MNEIMRRYDSTIRTLAQECDAIRRELRKQARRPRRSSTQLTTAQRRPSWTNVVRQKG